MKNDFENDFKKNSIIVIVSKVQINERIITNISNLNTKICLNNLNDKNKKRLMQKTMKKKFRTHRVKFYRKFEFEKNTI